MRSAVAIGLGLMIWLAAGTGFGAEPIIVGATVSLEGRYREPSLMIRDAFRLWEAQVNRRGGLLGRPVRLVLYDDRSDPQRTADLYRKLLTADRADLLLSPYGTPLTMEASTVAEQHGKVLLACAASGAQIWRRGYRNVFGMYALADRYFIGLLDLMARRGMRSVALMFDQASSFNTNVVDGAQHWARRFGLQVAFRKGFGPDGASLPELIDEVMRAKPDGLILSAYPPDCYTLIEELKSRRYRPRVLGMTIAPIHPDFHQRVGSMAEGVFGPSQWEPDERIPFPGTRPFVAAFRERTGRMPSYHAGSAYAACQIIEKAVVSTGGLEQETLREYILALDTVTVIGRFKVDHAGRQVGHNPIMIQWQNGRKEIVYPSKMQTAEPVF
jgi:branched-chain amino acid transport system substrate-binding protein